MNVTRFGRSYWIAASACTGSSLLPLLASAAHDSYVTGGLYILLCVALVLVLLISLSLGVIDLALGIQERNRHRIIGSLIGFSLCALLYLTLEANPLLGPTPTSGEPWFSSLLR